MKYSQNRSYCWAIIFKPPHRNWNIDWNHGEISCAARRDECSSSPCKTKHATCLKEQSSDKFYRRLALTEIVIRSTLLLHVSGDDDDVSVIPLNRYTRPTWCPVCTITRWRRNRSPDGKFVLIWFSKCCFGSPIENTGFNHQESAFINVANTGDAVFQSRWDEHASKFI